MGRRDDGDDWLDEVADALADLGLFDAPTREALLETVRDAVQEALPDRPPVTVLPGGRTDRDGPSLGPPPDLRVVQGDGGEDPDPPVSVRVVRMGRQSAPQPAGRARSLAEGQIAVGPGEDVWQTLRHGQRASAYRIHCDQGELHVAADGDLVVRLEAGQSSDVEGSLVRVRACGPRPARGRFIRLEG
jgi:hypothetical protein